MPTTTELTAICRTLKWELEQDGVYAIVEMSRRGAHLWILCAEPLPAKLCRIYIYNLALRLDVPIKGTFKQVDGIEVFPRQDELGAEEFGNAIRAPLGIHRANMHRYWFEDAASGLEEQLEYLRTVKRLTASELESFTEGLSIPESVTSRPVIERPTVRHQPKRFSDPATRQGSSQTKRQLLDAMPVLRQPGP